MKIYLAGPMSGIKDFNFPAFHKAAKLLRTAGHSVFSPAEKDEETYDSSIFKGSGNIEECESNGFDLRRAFYEDTKFICLEADAIALLPGWEASRGARAEWALAHALRLKFIYL